jgi:hypothetical protein
MWLDVVSCARVPSFSLEDQSFRVTSRVCLGVHAFGPFGNPYTCACAHTVEYGNAMHTLGCIWLSSLVQSCRDNTLKVLRELVGQLASLSTVRVGTLNLHTAPPAVRT